MFEGHWSLTEMLQFSTSTLKTEQAKIFNDIIKLIKEIILFNRDTISFRVRQT